MGEDVYVSFKAKSAHRSRERSLSTFLVAEPSLIEGIARMLDFGNTLSMYNYSRGPKQADARAILADWITVGRDISSAMDEFTEVAVAE